MHKSLEVKDIDEVKEINELKESEGLARRSSDRVEAGTVVREGEFGAEWRGASPRAQRVQWSRRDFTGNGTMNLIICKVHLGY